MLLLLGMSCSPEPGSSAAGSTAAAAREPSVILHVSPVDSEDTETVEFEVTEVECGEIWTRAEMGDDFISVRANAITSEPALDITVSIAMLDVFGGYRDTLMADEAEFTKAEDGSVSGAYEFRLYGEDAANYRLEMEIPCG